MSAHIPMPIGTRIGDREIVAFLGFKNRGSSIGAHYLVRCKCGREQIVYRSGLMGTTQCRYCSRQCNARKTSNRPLGGNASGAARLLREASDAWPQLWRTETDESLAACAELAAGGPFALSEIAALLGITSERVRQIEAAALKKLRPRVELVGISAADIADRFTTWDAIELIDRMEAA